MKKLIYSIMVMATAFAFTSCEDVPMPYDMTFEENGGSTDTPQAEAKGTGTMEDPFNIAAAQNFITAGKDLDKIVYVKGVISNIKEIDDATFGNATYYISDDGSITNQFLVYRGYALGNKKFTSKDLIKKGDKVVICGKLINFNGTKEFAQGNYIYSLNGKTNEPTPATDLNTEATAFTVAQAIQKIKDNDGKALNGEAYVKGIISEVFIYNEKYKSISYYISDNGTDKALQIYSGKGLNGADFKSIDDLKAGQTVVVKGFLKAFTNKNGETIYEMDKENKLISISEGAAPNVGLEATFAENMGGFTIVNVKPLPSDLEFVWYHDAKYKQMKATGFKKPNSYETQSRIVSPSFSLQGLTKATLSFQHAANFFKAMPLTEGCKVFASTDGKKWTALNINGMPSGTDWTFVDATCDMTPFAGKTQVFIAFEYNSSAEAAGTWEIKNVVVK